MTHTTKPMLPYLCGICYGTWRHLNTPKLSQTIALDGPGSFQILVTLILYRARVLGRILLTWHFSWQVLIDLLHIVNCHESLEIKYLPLVSHALGVALMLMWLIEWLKLPLDSHRYLITCQGNKIYSLNLLHFNK